MASKKMMESFHKRVVKIVLSLGGTLTRKTEDGRIEMEITTKAGLLFISLHAPAASGLFSIFMRFDDVDRANKILGDDSQNKHSGKWNIHELSERESLFYLTAKLNKIAEPPQNSMQKYPEFQRLVNEIANEACKQINIKAPKIESTMPYKTQFVLEAVIKVLESRV